MSFVQLFKKNDNFFDIFNSLTCNLQLAVAPISAPTAQSTNSEQPQQQQRGEQQ